MADDQKEDDKASNNNKYSVGDLDDLWSNLIKFNEKKLVSTSNLQFQ